MSEKVIEKGWLSYENKVIPNNAGRIQRIETRRAFYAGAAELISALSELASSTTEEDMFKILDGIQEEFDDLLDRVKKGHA